MVLGWPLHPAPHCTLQQLCLAAAWQHHHCSTAALVCSGWAGLCTRCRHLHLQPSPAPANTANQPGYKLAKFTTGKPLPPPPPCLVPAWHRPTRSGVSAGHVSRVTCHVSGAGRLTPNNYSVAGAGKLSATVWSVAAARSHNVGTPRPGHSPGQWTQGSTSY